MTDFLEDQTQVTDSLPIGTSFGSGESQILDSVTGGTVAGLSNKVATTESQLNQYLQEATANAIQKTCGSEAWSQTEAAVKVGYEIEAKDQGLPTPTVTFLPGTPSFEGPYPDAKAPGESNRTQIQDVSCQVAGDAFEIAKGFKVYHPEALTPVEAVKN